MWEPHFFVYRARKVSLQLNREGIEVARCTVERLMRRMGRRGWVRARTFKVTTHAAERTDRPLDVIDRDFTASRPNEPWVSDLTYVRLGSTFCCVALVIDVYARMIVGWQISSSLRSELAFDALEQAITERLCEEAGSLVHHSDRGGQYLSLRYAERLALAGIEPSVGSRGDSYDNALTETIIGLEKTELIELPGPWSRFEDVELATLKHVWWFNNHRLLPSAISLPPNSKNSNVAV